MISVIIPVRNGMPWLKEQLRAVSEQECQVPWELIVVDNNSTDESKMVVQEWSERGQRVRLVDASKVRGPGATANVGVSEAQGDLLAFCDADDAVQPGWLVAHVSALSEADLSAGVVDYWSLNGLEAPVGPVYAPPPAIGLLGFLPAASGNMAIRRNVFEEVGGFAEDLTTGEDFDLSWRVQLAGHRYALSPDAVIARRDRQGFQAIFSRYTAYGRWVGSCSVGFELTAFSVNCRSPARHGCGYLFLHRVWRARVPRPLGPHCRMENRAPSGVRATAGSLPLIAADRFTSHCRP